VLAEEHEHAEPSWGPGQRSYAWSPDGTELAWCRNESGLASLVIGAPNRHSARVLAKAWHQGLDWSDRGIVAIRSGAVTPAHVVVLAANGSGRRRIARGPAAGFERAGLAEPRPVTWRSNGATVHGLLYRPATSALGAGNPPPMYVHIHGGPTGQASAQWSARTQYFVERGWAVLAPDYRGSTGYGRDYAQALAGQWGERDVADVAAGIRHAGREGWCDPARVAVVGGSAGGLTVLLLCALHGDVVRAGVSLFGVTDLFDLAATTHRFESRYLDRIVGVLPLDASRYRERSPVTYADAISVPLLVLQGAQDKVVPPAQAERLVDAMRAAGRTVEYQLYEGEGHGWRMAGTVADELQRTESFLRTWVLER
jgi:dipeptidyl aminopeptidase/acylaminoacyl peptidase